jgi:hypothetical protein
MAFEPTILGFEADFQVAYFDRSWKLADIELVD